MKRRLFAVLMALMMFSGYAVISFADNEEAVTTGTQKTAQENVVDVDADIKEAIKSIIPEDVEKIRIGSADEFMDMVQNCKLDTWSCNKMIIITEDISLLGKDFTGISSFAGTIDGQGHTISDFNISNGLSYSGFFTYIEEGAVIKDLNLTGSVIPKQDATFVGGFCGENKGIITDCSFKGVVYGTDYVGGIAGINDLTGDIRFCTSEGFINGTHFTGGIVGKNDGNIANCRNEALVNTTNTDTEITIDSMERLNAVINIFKNGIGKDEEEARSDVTVSDTGGIAGISIGIIARCINNGEIGYDHVGYNVGGIAGRQSGYIISCSNNGLVKGRKDVGGIVGQAEPYITIDFATDIAYQLSESIAKLHDTISATLNDTKNQSDVVSARLATISKFTGQAVEDTRFLANGVTDYANGISSATSEAFSRVDYLIDEASKNGGILDNTNSAVSDAQKSASKLKSVANDLDVEQYIKSDDLKQQYRQAQVIINTGAAIYASGVEASYRTYYNNYIKTNKSGLSGDPIYYFDNSGVQVDESNWSITDMDNYKGSRSDTTGNWKHQDASGKLTDFPILDKSDDVALDEAAAKFATDSSSLYAKSKYENPYDSSKTGAVNYDKDMEWASDVILQVYTDCLPDMSEKTRVDAQSAMGYLESSAGNLKDAGVQTKSVLGNIAKKDDIQFPQFNNEFKAHTSSLADNMAAMNDNFALLNSEMNNATGVMVSDLQEVNDQFNNILNLYTDAMDGVLEKDYTDIFSDDSLSDAERTTDSTIDSCFNFGECRGDIDVSGIAGTMAIEYDFDKESDITGLKESGLNTSYLTKCVLRDNRNYGDIVSEKNYAGGICGLQEMGTILNCGNYSKVKATNGSYVGGVAGSSISYILQSYAKGELEGLSYVGGITGDGKNIRECLTIVSISPLVDWSGAIAGHISDNGEVRDNFFVSDDLSGIDRVSYSLKAEPVDYETVFNNKVFKILEKETEEKEEKVVPLSTGNDEQISDEEEYRDLPLEFRKLNVIFVLEDDDLPDKTEKVGRISKDYGDELSITEYPGVKEKDGNYYEWDITGIDKLTCDVTITASYKRYRTTIAEGDSSDSLHQSELLVDGLFKDNDELIVNRTVEEYNEEQDQLNREILEVTIPDDGQSVHQIRFRPLNDYMLLFDTVGKYFGGKPVLSLMMDNGELKELTPTGTMGLYSTYDIEGNDFTLYFSIEGAKNVAIIIVVIVIAIILGIIVLIVIIVNIIKRHGGEVPKIFNGFIIRVSEKIENKEQLFYDDSKDDKSKTLDKDPAEETEDAENVEDTNNVEDTDNAEESDEDEKK